MKILIILLSALTTVYTLNNSTNSTMHHTFHFNNTHHRDWLHHNYTRPRTFLKFIPHVIPRTITPLANTALNIPHIPSVVVSPLTKFRMNRNAQNNIPMTRPDHTTEFMNHINRLKSLSGIRNVTQEAMTLLHNEEQKLIKDYYDKKNELSHIKSFFMANHTVQRIHPRLNLIKHKPTNNTLSHNLTELSKLNQTFHSNSTALNTTSF